MNILVIVSGKIYSKIEMQMNVFGNSKRGIRIICPYQRAKKEKSDSLDDKNVLQIRKYKSVLWKKYHNSGSYNDLCEYKRVLNRANSEYLKAKYSFEKKLASNVKTDPKSF